MEQKSKIGVGLILFGLFMFGLFLSFPVDPVLVHDTRTATNINESEADRYGYEVVAYENLSERGQELYVKTLEKGGVYRVPIGEGAEEFDYPTEAERQRAAERGNLTGAKVNLLIERPANDSHLPPADERYDERDADQGYNRTEYKRYDLMTAKTKTPPIGSGAHMPRLAALAISIVSMSTGTYMIVSKKK